MKKVEILFEYEKSTKNTYRYQEVPVTAPIIGSLYVQKWHAGQSPPKRIKVTLETENV